MFVAKAEVVILCFYCDTCMSDHDFSGKSEVSYMEKFVASFYYFYGLQICENMCFRK